MVLSAFRSWTNLFARVFSSHEGGNMAGKSIPDDDVEDDHGGDEPSFDVVIDEKRHRSRDAKNLVAGW